VFDAFDVPVVPAHDRSTGRTAGDRTVVGTGTRTISDPNLVGRLYGHFGFCTGDPNFSGQRRRENVLRLDSPSVLEHLYLACRFEVRQLPRVLELCPAGDAAADTSGAVSRQVGVDCLDASTRRDVDLGSSRGDDGE